MNSRDGYYLEVHERTATLPWSDHASVRREVGSPDHLCQHEGCSEEMWHQLDLSSNSCSVSRGGGQHNCALPAQAKLMPAESDAQH